MAHNIFADIKEDSYVDRFLKKHSKDIPFPHFE